MIFFRNPAIKQMQEKVLHTGIIQAVSEDKLTVTIVSASACSSCHAKGACLASDMKEKEIDIYRFDGKYQQGQHVNIVGQTSQGYKAAFYGYVLPFLLVFATLLITISITHSDGLSGLLSLAILIPYYAVLYFFRNNLKRSFEFEISAIN
ncbi:MAG: SoxR reducing system RseC family protein [Prolixibacteraceae bacterium]|nr:SoxR reducing system RseC family protein [Prolixibacteraceae bacterium]